ncbi:uncharacterized protein LOC142073861 [Calonectris borealis]|uniref:uncharacterized protein LOC142073861 n=1 Tax=Calonectris borealis TaxID=1323832 RepID=UPI003F4B14DB
MAFCLNDTHCGCPRGYRPPPWARNPHRPRELRRCGRVRGGGGGAVQGGLRLLQHPRELRVPLRPRLRPRPRPRLRRRDGAPKLCSDDQSGCGLAETLTHLYGRLRGGGDPHHILQDLLAILDEVFGGGTGTSPGVTSGPPRCWRPPRGWCGGWGPSCPRPPPPPSPPTAQTCAWPAPGAPPGPVRLRVPGVELDVPGEVAGDSDTGQALVALLSQRGLGRVLEGARKVQWGGVGELPPPQAGVAPPTASCPPWPPPSSPTPGPPPPRSHPALRAPPPGAEDPQRLGDPL